MCSADLPTSPWKKNSASKPNATAVEVQTCTTLSQDLKSQTDLVEVKFQCYPVTELAPSNIQSSLGAVNLLAKPLDSRTRVTSLHHS
jgi:hypothetical protein